MCFVSSWSSGLVVGGLACFCECLFVGVLQTFVKLHRFMYSKRIIVNKIIAHLSVPLMPNKPWNILPIPAPVFVMAPPIQSMTFKARIPKRTTNFSSRFPTPFWVSCIDPLIDLIIGLPPSTLWCKAEPRTFSQIN